MKRTEARHYTKGRDGRLECALCPHNCSLTDGKSGICGVRTNIGGTLFSDNYARVSSIAMDPIEKKPLYHFHPGSSILSIGTVGCNMKCSYCQNWHISQNTAASTSYYEPSAVVRSAARQGSVGIAYTYSEPIVWFEYVMDCAKEARKAGLKNVLVTNGFINPGPLDELLGLVDAMNIDLKTFRDETYKKYQRGRLQPVLDAITGAHGRCHIELTTLIVTGINDDIEEMRDIMDWIASVDRKMPWHVSRYYPNCRHDAPATGVGFIMDVCEEARRKLDFVYCGNIPGGRNGSDTLCPSCGGIVIGRNGYSTRIIALDDGRCGRCGADLGVRH
ncbi:MAG TPA: AmmeMemoRadiSam system radical SAM enzyme [Spirochaetota bacterium]|nr:AmmeMemoRadiSam system radical SAM enzyme [Spirochaetota bacterium]